MITLKKFLIAKNFNDIYKISLRARSFTLMSDV